MTPQTAEVILHHGTTLLSAGQIEKFGPDPNYREPGGEHQPPALGFSACRAGESTCLTGLPEEMAQRKAKLFPAHDGPAIIEEHVPEWIMQILYRDTIAAGLSRHGEIRFEPESGLEQLRAEWPNLTKRVIPL